MCGRIIQSSGPLRYATVDGVSVRDSRVHNYPPRWNAAPSQELLVIRRNHQTGEVSLGAITRMNVWLHKQVMTKLAETGGKIPDSLKT
jgi:putative SOS response-associated peptidase YedK